MTETPTEQAQRWAEWRRLMEETSVTTYAKAMTDASEPSLTELIRRLTKERSMESRERYRISPTYTDLDMTRIMYPAPRAVADKLRAVMPSPHDMNAELRREIQREQPGVEFVPMQTGRNVTMESGGQECTYTRHKLYANTRTQGDAMLALPRSADAIRAEFLHFARAFGRRIAGQIGEYRARCAAIGGAHATPAVALRFAGDTIIRAIMIEPDEPPTVFRDDYEDALLMRWASYYFITPTGPVL